MIGDGKREEWMVGERKKEERGLESGKGRSECW